MELKEVHSVFEKWLNYEDEKQKRMELMLAVTLTRPIKDVKLWVIIVGFSGDGKSEMINAFDDGGFHTKMIRRFTSKTLVSGYKKAKDLAPELKDKLVLIPDFANFMTLPPTEKAAVWAQLRDLYDGIAGSQSGSGTDEDYKDLNITMIGCSTPAIDTQVLQSQSLGTRELLWRTEGSKNDRDLREKLTNNREKMEEMKSELKKSVFNYIDNHNFKYIKIDKKTNRKLFSYAKLLCLLRCVGDIDWKDNELSNFTYPEEPTRVFSQLQILFMALKSLDADYSDERAFEVIDHLVASSGIPVRQEVIDYVTEHPKQATNKIAKDLKIGVRVVFRELNILNCLGMVEREDEEYLDKPWVKPTYRWVMSKKYDKEVETINATTSST